jgi:hypothetical protein
MNVPDRIAWSFLRMAPCRRLLRHCSSLPAPIGFASSYQEEVNAHTDDKSKQDDQHKRLKPRD